MISVLSHLPLLNGSKYSIFVLLSLLSCTATKNVAKTDQVQIVKSEPARVGKDSTEIPVIAIPKNKDIAKTDSNVKVDTVIWKDVSSANPPIVVKEKKMVEYRDGLAMKDSYLIKMLIPLNSDGLSDPSSSRFVHFYAGALKALEILDDEGLSLNIKIIDTEEGSYQVKDQISTILTDSTDLIIGPFEKDDLKLLADECKLKAIPIVSPWQTSTKLTNENPYYVQMKPNLKEHFLKLAQSISSTYQSGEVVIVGKNNKETNSWIKYFQEAAAANVKKKDFFSTYFVSTDSLNLGPTAFFRMFKDHNVKAVILPNYSYNDEDFIYAALRRLAAEKGTKQISVYGMPILYDSDKVDFDFYHALQMKVVMSDFVDENYGKIREFRREYLDLYGEIPTSDAVKGYDLMLYLGRNIWKYGKNFQNYLSEEATSYLQSTYDIQKAKSEDSPVFDDLNKFDYFENKHLDIIEFKGNKWQKKH